VGHLHGLARPLDRIGIHRVAVVLRADGDLARGQILARLVASVMAEFEFPGLAPQRQTEDLVAQTDAKKGLEGRQLADHIAHPLHGLGIPGAVGEKDAIGLQGQGLCRGGRRGNDRHLETLLDQQAQDSSLDPEIVGHQATLSLGTLGTRHLPLHARPAALGPEVGSARNLGDEVAAIESGGASRLGHQGLGLLQRGIGAEHPDLGPRIANAAHQRPGIDARNPRHVRLGEESIDAALGAPVAGLIEQFANHEAREKGAGRLLVLGVDPHVADLGIGHGHDLTRVGGVGDDLLVARHARIEDHLARAHAYGPEGLTPVDGAVGQRERGRTEVSGAARPEARSGVRDRGAHRTRTPLSAW